MADGPILIGYDGSPSAAEAIGVAASLLGARPAVVVSVWSPAPVETVAYGATGDFASAAPAYFSDVDSTIEKQAVEMAERGARIAREAGFEAEARSAQGNSGWQGIVDTAAAVDAAAIVVGARGLSGLKSVLLGSTSKGVLHHAGRPVLVVQQSD
jgi:nucleotide-binding universal stress UspA family protein